MRPGYKTTEFAVTILVISLLTTLTNAYPDVYPPSDCADHLMAILFAYAGLRQWNKSQLKPDPKQSQELPLTP